MDLCWDNIVVITISDTNFAYSAWEQQKHKVQMTPHELTHHELTKLEILEFDMKQNVSHGVEAYRKIQSVLDQIVGSKSHHGYKVEQGKLFIMIKLATLNKLTHIALIFTTYKYKHKTVLETTNSQIPKHSCTVFDRGRTQKIKRHNDLCNPGNVSTTTGLF